MFRHGEQNPFVTWLANDACGAATAVGFRAMPHAVAVALEGYSVAGGVV